jgi:hypothetical protein
MLLSFKENYFECMGILPARESVFHVCPWCQGGQKRGLGAPETGVAETQIQVLEEQQLVLLNLELSL